MKQTLFATPATVKSVASARAAVVLVGGYDGSGNYGDIALLEAALDLVERLGPKVAVLPLLERSLLEDHRALPAWGEGRAATPIFFDAEGGLDDDLLPLAAPADLAFAACYLYGGGYLNRSWGDRKLAMLRAAEALFEAGEADRVCRVASGLQVEERWIQELGAEDAAALRAFDFLGVRDGGSARALASLGSSAPVTETADDAIAVLQRPPEGAAVKTNGRLRVNVHFADHAWVSARPEAVLEHFVGLLAELSRLADRPVVAQPLIAYSDRRTDERPGVALFDAAVTGLGIEVADPLLLRPGIQSDSAPQLCEASLTLSCSYHVALTSLMLGIPAVLLADSEYYAQKAIGLVADFELPTAFMTSADADPVAAARAVAGAALARDGSAALRPRLQLMASRLRRRRAATEVELLGRLGGGAVTALDLWIEQVTERLRQRSVEPAELRAQLAELETERERAAEQLATEAPSPLEAELRAYEAETQNAAAQATLAEILQSRSWRMLAPLRRLGALARRLRRR